VVALDTVLPVVRLDTAMTFWQLGDSMAIQVRRIPHGRGVVVEILAVRKVKKLPAIAGTKGAR
jgi:hypothetical protein